MALLSSAAAFASLSGAASAAPFTAGCSGTQGNPASLIAAIESANAVAGPDTVVLGAGCTYALEAPVSWWYGPDGLPPISSDITIEGHGATITRSASAPPFRLFFVGADPANALTKNYLAPGESPGGGRLTLREVTLTRGLAQGGDSNGGGGGAGMGGAIFNQGVLTVERSTLTGNAARGGSAIDPSAGSAGGGIGSNASGETGGGFGGGSYPGSGSGGTAGEWGGGGGAGFATGESGGSGTGKGTNTGGGPQSGLGGYGAGGAAPGDGSGSGANVCCGTGSSTGGTFGSGGVAGLNTGAGGGVGGGGGARTFGGGGGGFGGGGGQGDSAEEKHGGFGGSGGSGGFGGGGAVGYFDGSPGFGGGTPGEDVGGAGGGLGGAIFNMQGTLTITASTVASNSALGGDNALPTRGRGIAGGVFNLSGAFTAADSTFAGNSGPDFAAQIFNLVYDGHLERVAHTSLRNTIVAGGIGPIDLASNKTEYMYGVSNLGSASADLTASDLVRTAAALEHGTLTGTPLTADPLLGPLQGNGGATATMALAAGSPAIDAGTGCGPFDQRGLPRPDRGEATCDIGAYETQDPPPAGGGQAAVPVLRGLKFSRSGFRAAPKGASIAARHHYGSRLSFVLSIPAGVTFTVDAVRPGRRDSHGHCGRPGRSNRRGRACKRQVALRGSFSFSGSAGPNSLRFTGRVGGRTLAPGAYVLLATPRTAARRGPSVKTAFSILR